MFEGKCECGRVHFEVEEINKAVSVCHCTQCRRTSGHLWASSHLPDASALKFRTDEGLTWFASSDFAQRGFCRFCGSSMFYRMNTEAGIAIAAGCISEPTGAHIAKHIFVRDKGDYYEITDSAEQVETF